MSQTEENVEPVPTTFGSLGLNEHLLLSIDRLGYKSPTEIQVKCIPPALEGRDIIGIATTGSGKTAAFALPILQKLWDQIPTSQGPAIKGGGNGGLFACVLAPTRELAFQISESFERLGKDIGVRCAVIVGGAEDTVTQAISLAKKPHVIVATPGRLRDHLQSTKGFNLKTLKFLVLDEADRLLDLSLGPTIEQILKFIPKERTTYLFSATMSTQVSKLQRGTLSNPMKIEVSSKYQTVPTLLQYFAFAPLMHKEVSFIHLVNTLSSNTIIVFTRTVHDAQRLVIMLRHLGFSAIPLHGQLSQAQRLGALEQFKSGKRSILVATDVASRGLDIPCVDVVINYDMPTQSKEYIHRVGRTARAGKAGKAISMITQYDIEFLQRIEKVMVKKLDKWPGLPEKGLNEEMMLLKERVEEAGRFASSQIKEKEKEVGEKGRKRKFGGQKGREKDDDADRDDDVVQADISHLAHRRKKKRA
ncbi:DEAD box helicase family protein [Abortiporus biennis]